jgi:hypothetical protein
VAASRGDAELTTCSTSTSQQNRSPIAVISDRTLIRGRRAEGREQRRRVEGREQRTENTISFNSKE